MDRERRIHDLIAELAAIPFARRSPSLHYEQMALELALRMRTYEHADELERLAAEKAEEPVPSRDDDDGAQHWDLICQRGPELLKFLGAQVRDGVKTL